ncbi:MAG: exonuclease [Aequorivita sp.]|nr:exonuclease [Aequorivita sp.]|tara:strand:+ start:105212 stop:106591 length:1380 start_codon:yes stop_codon:yes gene_type:complete
MYAVLDIETTGGKYNEEGITEIAIYKFDGHKIVDQFSSLVNPEIPIQPFVVNLTGINNEMLKNAPKFYEVAKRIIEITEGCTLVAHNALFDNRILTTEFKRLGYKFERETICTVELAQKLIPDMPSYSLGKLVRALGIPLSDRHRAQGDAKATVALFKLLLAKDTSKEIVTETLRESQNNQLEPKLNDIVESVPADVGVYYIRNANRKIIYIGKSKNIRKRLIQHFTSENRKSNRIQLEVKTVTFEKTGNQLIALLKEREERKKNKPKYNRAVRKSLYSYQLVSFVDDNGYVNLKVEKSIKNRAAITTFSNYQQAKKYLHQITDEYQLCAKLTGLETKNKTCSNYAANQCYGACLGDETVEEYNNRINQFLEKSSFINQTKLIIDKGREVDERSVILIENGIYQGYGYYNLNYQITNPEILKTIITPTSNYFDAQHIIQSYLRKNKVLKIVNLAPKTVN